jgi:two-component system, LytTR family, sensor kinase
MKIYLTKVLFFFAYLLLSVFFVQAQTRKEWGYPEKYDLSSFTGKSSILDKDGYAIPYGVARSVGVDHKSKYKQPLYKIPLTIRADKVAKAISPYNFIPGDPLGSIVYLEGATAVKLQTYIHIDSLNDYRYSIIENDTVVKAWDAKFTNIDFVTPKGADFPYHAYVSLVLSNIQNKKIVFKAYKLAKPYEVTTLVLYNKPILLPKVEVMVTNAEFGSSKKLKDNEVFDLSKGPLVLSLKMRRTDLDFANKVVLRFTKGGKVYSSVIDLDREWSADNGDRQFILHSSEFKEPGQYEILLQANVRSFKDFKPISAVSALKFTVPPPPIVFSIREIVLTSLVIIGGAGLVIFIIRRANKRKQRALSLKAETAKNELNSVRSQLNPHFVFNALSGIQNLMNNNSLEEANNYLGKFANLTRQILDERELISIEDEVKLLYDYLSMEQLRFSFSVEFIVDEEESFRYTEIPTMLLQPFVENAVKHGIASLKGEGKIVVTLVREQQNIVLMVKDKGKGFERAGIAKGLGLKLSEKRIALLNENYKTCPIELKIDSSSGTTVRITLTNWLT